MSHNKILINQNVTGEPDCRQAGSMWLKSININT